MLRAPSLGWERRHPHHMQLAVWARAAPAPGLGFSIPLIWSRSAMSWRQAEQHSLKEACPKHLEDPSLVVSENTLELWGIFRHGILDFVLRINSVSNKKSCLLQERAACWRSTCTIRGFRGTGTLEVCTVRVSPHSEPTTVPLSLPSISMASFKSSEMPTGNEVRRYEQGDSLNL